MMREMMKQNEVKAKAAAGGGRRAAPVKIKRWRWCAFEWDVDGGINHPSLEG